MLLEKSIPFRSCRTRSVDWKRVGGEVTMSGTCLARIKPGHHRIDQTHYGMCTFIIHIICHIPCSPPCTKVVYIQKKAFTRYSSLLVHDMQVLRRYCTTSSKTVAIRFGCLSILRFDCVHNLNLTRHKNGP